MMKEYCFIYNPAANRKKSLDRYHKLLSLTENWANTDHIIPEDHAELKAVASQAAGEYEVLVACGGDGTVQEIAVSVLHTTSLLGIIPLGSGNDFIKSLNIPTNLQEGLKLIRRKRHKKVDIGSFNHGYFINTLGFGFDGLTNRYATQSGIGNGALRYALGALRANLNREVFRARIEVDGKTIAPDEMMMMTFANGRVEGGSFMISPDSSVSDGSLELVVVRPVPKWLFPIVLPIFLSSFVKKLPYLEYYTGKHFSIELDRPLEIHSDGEQVSDHDKSFTVEVIPSSVMVIC